MAMEASGNKSDSPTDVLHPGHERESEQKTGKLKTSSSGTDATNTESARVKSSCRKSSTKKRRKSNMMSANVHPSVKEAQKWTDRAEQAEELRARESRYMAPTSEMAPPRSSTTLASKAGFNTSTALNVAEAGIALFGSGSEATHMVTASAESTTRKRVKRPWEWSAKECQELLQDTIRHPGVLLNPSLVLLESTDPGCKERAGFGPLLSVEAKEISNGSESGGSSSAMTGIVGGLESKGNASHSNNFGRLERRVPLSSSSPVLEKAPQKQHLAAHEEGIANATPNLHPKAGTEVHRGYPSRERYVPKFFNPSLPNPPHGSSDTNSRHQTPKCTLSRGFQRGKGGSAGAVDYAQDGQKARELNALLNRNKPRRCVTSEGNRQHTPQLLSPAKHPPCPESCVRHDAKEELEHIEPGSLRVSGEQITSPARRRRWPMNVGTLAEVRWGNRWYRCTVHSVSAGGKLGVLMFIPPKSRMKKQKWREYSTELDIDELVSIGRLVRPKTHLEWD